MQKHKCKLCSKSFCNGRALGGHMKSHLVSPAAAARKKLLADSSLYSSSSSSDAKSLAYGLRENPRKSFRVLNPDPESSSIVYDSQTETEPESEDPVKKRSRAEVTKKRGNKKTRSKKQKVVGHHINSNESPEPAMSSVSDGSPEQDLALCLMMLSRDSRRFEMKVEVVEEKKPERRQFPELRRCMIDLNLPPPQESEGVSVVSAI